MPFGFLLHDQQIATTAPMMKIIPASIRRANTVMSAARGRLKYFIIVTKDICEFDALVRSKLDYILHHS